MTAKISCPAVQVFYYEVEVKFPKSLRTRCGEFWTLCGQLLVTACGGAWEAFTSLCRGLLWGCRGIGVLLAAGIGIVTLLMLLTMAYMWIPVIMGSCHKGPGIQLGGFSIREMAAFQSVSSIPASPWQVNSAFNATFSTWNRNTVTKCFTTYRHMNVRVEYKGQVILQQQVPLGFSLKPRHSRPFSIEVKNDHADLKKEIGPVMQAELRSDNITLEFYYDTRYLIADRRSKWENIGCVVVAKPPLGSSRLGTMLTQDCYDT